MFQEIPEKLPTMCPALYVALGLERIRQIRCYVAMNCSCVSFSTLLLQVTLHIFKQLKLNRGVEKLFPIPGAIIQHILRVH